MMRQKVRIPSILSALFFALCGLMSLYLTYKTAGNLLDSDASSELVLARLLADTNQILSRDWFYSTELRVLNTQLIYMPLFKIFSDWKLVRFFGALLLQAILVLSYYFLSRQAGFSRNVFFLTGGLLLLPASTPYARIVLLHSYYVPHIAIGFFLLGLLLGFGNSEKKKGLRIAYLVLFLLLSLLSGLGGVRQLLVTFLPLLAAAFLLLLCSDGFRGVTHAEMDAGSVSALRRLRTAACCREARTLYLSAAGAAFAAVGYLLNSRVLDGIYSFTNYGGMRLKNPAVGDVDPLFSALLELFGYKANAKVFSKEGIASLLGAACLVLVLLMGIYLVVRIRRVETLPWRLLALFFVCTLVLNTAVFLLTKTTLALYYIPIFIYFVPLLAVWLGQCKRAFPPLWCGAAGLVAAVFFVNSLLITHYFVKKPQDSPIVYSGLVYTERDTVEHLTPVVGFLQDNGYTFGYANFWDANVITEMTNGQIEMVNTNIGQQLTPYNWLMSKKLLEPGYHTGKTFVLLSAVGEKSSSDAGYDWLKQGEKVYSDGRFSVYAYDGPLL